ncbi:MAG: DUF1501 domain-containing protein [Pirellulales bacterium]
MPQPHVHRHAFDWCNAQSDEGLVLRSRRNLLKASVAGMAGLSVPGLLRHRQACGAAGVPSPQPKSVILLWMAGGPSHIDTWDPKPGRPVMNRGPFSPIQTALPGVSICEHLPKQAAMLDKFTLIRSVDASHSNHEPNMVFQTGNLAAAPRINREAEHFPAIASVVAKERGPNHPAMPPYVAFYRSRSHLAFAGYLGKQYDPFQGNQAARLPVYDYVGGDVGQVSGADVFQVPGGLDFDRIRNRRELLVDFDNFQRHLDQDGSMSAMDAYQRQAAEMLVGRRARDAFDLEQEPAATRERYGKHLWCQQALLARRLVQAGVNFVTLDLSYHPSSGTWDTHGDNIPPYGGILRGLGPLLPLFDHLLTTLVSDLDEQGLLDQCLVIAMGEFGRTPNMGTQDSSDGRNHWPNIMSMSLAGGGMRHGQVIGASESDGGSIRERPVTPGDLAATIYQHFGVPLDTTYLDHRGRPRYIIESGTPLRELV